MTIDRRHFEGSRPISNGVRVLQIGSDRSKRGILYPGSPGFIRQEAYARQFGYLDIIGLSRRGDGTTFADAGALRVYPTNSTSPLMYLFDTLRIARTLPRPDVVSVQDPFEVGFIGWLVARAKDAPLHVQVHTDFLSPEYARHSMLNRLRVYLARFVLSRAARIRVVSKKIQHSLSRPATVLPIFTDVAGISALEADPSLVRAFGRFDHKLMFVGRLEPEKNPSLAIRAFAETAPERSCLIIIGSGSQESTLKELARKLNVMEGSRQVVFEDRAESKKYYPLPDLILVPSLYEGYGLVIVEALAAGKPVLSTDVGIAREAGAIIASPEQFAQALADWFKNGPREGHLKEYPYKNFDEYVQAYCDDVIACVGPEKTQ